MTLITAEQFNHLFPRAQENVNKSIEGVNAAQEGLLKSQNDMQKMTYKFALDTYQNRLLQEQFKAELSNWQGFGAMYNALIVTGKQIGRAHV